MESRPSYLGRGRGRGQRNQRTNTSHFSNVSRHSKSEKPPTPSHATSAWRSGPPGRLEGHDKNRHKNGHVPPVTTANERLKKFEEIRQATAKFTSEEMYLDSSDSDEDVNDDQILDNTLKTYQGDEDSLLKIKQCLQDSCLSGALTCLICIASVKHNDAIWNCGLCYSIFHLQCIQKWANDGAVQSLPLSREHFPEQEMKWFCPKCRCEYKQSERPTKYLCFCGKKVNPKFDPWSVPHSCGEACERQLTPDCGHSCLLLCHPGPCPPCPKMVQAKCHCGSQPPTVRRCSAKEWSCGKPCGKLLSCGHHTCRNPCHSGQCPACPEQSSQPCHCGRNISTRPCAEPDWTCSEVCGKLLECGNHTCEDVCHRGQCSPCPRSGKRTCPCGKTALGAPAHRCTLVCSIASDDCTSMRYGYSVQRINTCISCAAFDLPCTEDVQPCGDTCDRVLACGSHNCTRRCHFGSCETCRHMVTKVCRCGKRKKTVQCSQELTCDVKCPKLRNCGRHPCRRKCCEGSCPPCEQICNRPLSCQNHRCPSVCHQGFCYPCPLTQDVTCNCGNTKLTVPCGKERITKPPKCTRLCNTPSNCHHKERKPHRCHFGPCPPCKEICGYALPSCSHTCQMECHDNKICSPVKTPTLVFPWEAKPKEEPAKPLPCGPCTVPVIWSCLGEHETISMACFQAGPFTCGRPCGRLLPCTNHVCQLECHVVTNAPDKEKSGSNCEKCELPCSKPREPGCTHECLRRCHPGECGECQQLIKRQCHCSSMAVYIKCSELISSDEQSKVQLLSCKSRCPKSLSCGHQCPRQCHPGPCVSANNCSKKTVVRCPCKRRKKEYPCFDAQTMVLNCDENCKNHQIKTEKERKEQERIRQEEEMKANLEEVEKYERKKQGRKRRSRKQQEEIVEPSWLAVHKNIIAFTVIAVALLAFIVHIAVAE